MSLELARLRAYLLRIPSADVNPEHRGELEALPGNCWDDLSISDTSGMKPGKLYSRMENISWHHPPLSVRNGKTRGNRPGGRREAGAIITAIGQAPGSYQHGVVQAP